MEYKIIINTWIVPEHIDAIEMLLSNLKGIEVCGRCCNIDEYTYNIKVDNVESDSFKLIKWLQEYILYEVRGVI